MVTSCWSNGFNAASRLPTDRQRRSGQMAMAFLIQAGHKQRWSSYLRGVEHIPDIPMSGLPALSDHTGRTDLGNALARGKSRSYGSSRDQFACR